MNYAALLLVVFFTWWLRFADLYLTKKVSVKTMYTLLWCGELFIDVYLLIVYVSFASFSIYCLTNIYSKSNLSLELH